MLLILDAVAGRRRASEAAITRPTRSWSGGGEKRSCGISSPHIVQWCCPALRATACTGPLLQRGAEGKCIACVLDAAPAGADSRSTKGSEQKIARGRVDPDPLLGPWSVVWGPGMGPLVWRPPDFGREACPAVSCCDIITTGRRSAVARLMAAYTAPRGTKHGSCIS